MDLEAGLLHGLHDLLGRELVGSNGQNLVGVGGVYLPVLNAVGGFDMRGDSLDAVAAVDVGFESEGVHDCLF